MFNFVPVQSTKATISMLQKPGHFQNNMARRDTPVFFVFDHNMLKREDDDLKDAILYFCPEDVPADDQCELCGQLMGMVEYLNATISRSTPQIFKFEHQKFAVKHMGTYSLGIECPRFCPDSVLIKQLATLYKTFVFYHGSIDSLRLRHKDNHVMFLHELHSIWRTILSVSGFSMCASLPQTFQQLSYLELPKSSSHLFLQASHLLESSQKRPYVLAGAILYKHRVLSTQLSPDLTRQLTFLQQQMPHIVKSTDLDLPVGCRIITVLLTDEEFADITPPDPLAHRDCRITDFSSHQDSGGPPLNGTSLSAMGKLTRRQTCPNFAANLSESQVKTVSERAMQSFLTKEARLSQNRQRDHLNIERFTWRQRKSSSLSYVPIVECRSGESPIDSEKEILGHSADESHFSDNYKDLEGRQESSLIVPSSTSSTTTDNDEPKSEQPMKSGLQQPIKSKDRKFKNSKNISKKIKDKVISKLHLNKGASKHVSIDEGKTERTNKTQSAETHVSRDSSDLIQATTFSNQPIDKYANTGTNSNIIKVTVDIHDEGSRNSGKCNVSDMTDTYRDTLLTSGGFNTTDGDINYGESTSLTSSDFTLTKDTIDNEQSQNETHTKDTVNIDVGGDTSQSSCSGNTNNDNSICHETEYPKNDATKDKGESIENKRDVCEDNNQSDCGGSVSNINDSPSSVSVLRVGESKIESEGKTDTLTDFTFAKDTIDNEQSQNETRAKDTVNIEDVGGDTSQTACSGNTNNDNSICIETEYPKNDNTDDKDKGESIENKRDVCEDNNQSDCGGSVSNINDSPSSVSVLSVGESKIESEGKKDTLTDFTFAIKDTIDNEQSQNETRTNDTVNIEDVGGDTSQTACSGNSNNDNSIYNETECPKNDTTDDKDKGESIENKRDISEDNNQSDCGGSVSNINDSPSSVTVLRVGEIKIESEGKTGILSETNECSKTDYVNSDENLLNVHSCVLNVERTDNITEVESDEKDCQEIDSDLKASEVDNTHDTSVLASNSKLSKYESKHDKIDTVTEGICDERLDIKPETDINGNTRDFIDDEMSEQNPTTAKVPVRPDHLNLETSNNKLETLDPSTEFNVGVSEAPDNKENVDPSSVFKPADTCTGNINATENINQLDDYLTETEDEMVVKETHVPCICCLDLNSKIYNQSKDVNIVKCPQCLSKSNSYKIINPYGARKEVIDFDDTKTKTKGQGHVEGQNEGEGEPSEVDNESQRDTQAQTSAAQGVSFTSSFSSDVSTDSTISRFWTHEMDGLNDVTLYVQCHSDISLLLLMENPDKYEENLLHSLWKGSLSHLADLDFYIKESLDHSDDESLVDNYSYVKFDTYLHQLQGNVPEKSDHIHGRMHHAMATLHSDFQNHRCLTDVTLKSQATCVYGHRNYVDETYFQIDQPQKPSSGLPIDRDPTFSLDNIARQKLSRDKHISML